MSSDVQKILEWLPRAPPSFDSKFVFSLKDRLAKGLPLTDKQVAAARNIVIKFGIDAKPPKKISNAYERKHVLGSKFPSSQTCKDEN